MTKREIFKKILETTAYVCDVEAADIKDGNKRREDIVTARMILVFWCDAAGFSVESLVKCCDCNNAHSINSVKSRIEQWWTDKFAFHMLVKDVGVRLQSYAQSIDEDFDVWTPIRHMSKITGKY